MKLKNDKIVKMREMMLRRKIEQQNNIILDLQKQKLMYQNKILHHKHNNKQNMFIKFY